MNEYNRELQRLRLELMHAREQVRILQARNEELENTISYMFDEMEDKLCAHVASTRS